MFEETLLTSKLKQDRLSYDQLKKTYVLLMICLRNDNEYKGIYRVLKNKGLSI